MNLEQFEREATVERLRVQPGDCLVVSIDQSIPYDQFVDFSAAVKARLQEHFGKAVEVVVFGPGITVQHFGADDTAELKAVDAAQHEGSA